MRKFFFFAILAIGAGIGLLVAIAAKGEWGAGAVMVGIMQYRFTPFRIVPKSSQGKTAFLATIENAR